MLLQLGNFLKGRLAGPVAAGDTAITLASATFPTLLVDHVFYAVLQSAADRSRKEIVKVVGVAGTTITVQRAQEGTAALSFAANDLCEQRLTAAQFQYVADHVTDLGPHVPAFGAGGVGKVLKAAVNGYPAWGTLAPADVGALPISGGTLTGPLGAQTINGQGASIGWASLDVTGIKGGYAGIHFPSAGHWFGVQPNGLSGVWDSAGTSKWQFSESGRLGGGAVVPWNIIVDRPSRTNWANASASDVVSGQLAWKNYGNGHTIFDASAGTSPNGTTVDKSNAQIAWSGAAGYPSLMGWNGANTYGVRVDSARLADSANWAAQSDRATYLNGTVATVGPDITIHSKRAMVGNGGGNQLVVNYANDWGSTAIQGQLYTNALDSNRHLVIHNGSTVYGNSGLEVRTTDGSDARIGFHRYGYSAAAINHNSWGFQFERESGAGSRANVAAANFFADAAQDMNGNALTRLDYVGANFLKYRNRLSTDDGTTLDTVNREYGFNYSTGGGIFGPYISFGGLGGNYECQINADFVSGNDIKFRTHNGDANRWNPWHTIWNDGNFNPNNYLNATTGGTVSGTVYNSVTGVPNTFVGGKISSESGTLSLDAYTYAFVTSPMDAHLCYNARYQPSMGWQKYDSARTAGRIVINGVGLLYVRSDAGAADASQYTHSIWHSGNFNPDSKLSENGHYGGTLKLNNWFRSVGDSGWFSETHGGGIHMDEASTVKVYNGKKFYVANTEYNAIGATGGIFSYRGVAVDTRTSVGNGGSYNAWRYSDAPFHAGFGGLNVGSFAPIVGSANWTNGYGYTTRVQFGVLTPGATGWSNAVIMVGSAENDAHPLAAYNFGADGHITGSSKISTGYLFTERADSSISLELKNNTNHPGLAFHKPGSSWAELRHDGTRYYMGGDGQNFNIGNDMTCSYAYANGSQPMVANALTRKDYVDTKAALSGAAFTGDINVPSINGLPLRYESVGNSVAVRDGNGDLAVRLLRPEYTNQSDMYGAIAFRGAGGSGTDNYLRFCNSPSAVRSWIGAPSTAVATSATSGLMSASDKFKLDNIQRSKSTQETTLWSGEAGSSTSTITISESLYNYNAVRFQGTNADRDICWTLTMPAHEWAAQVATGKAVSIGAGQYHFMFAAPGLNSTTLTKYTTNCYLTKIVGLK